jgi:hypothetical protein
MGVSRGRLWVPSPVLEREREGQKEREKGRERGKERREHILVEM